MFRRTKSRRSRGKDASSAAEVTTAAARPPPGETAAPPSGRTRMSDRVFRDRKPSAEVDMGRNFLRRRHSSSTKTSDEQGQLRSAKAAVPEMTGHDSAGGDIPAHPAVRPIRRSMEPRDPGYEDITRPRTPTHSRQKSADLDKIRRSLSTRHEALRIYEDPYSYGSRHANDDHGSDLQGDLSAAPIPTRSHRRQAHSVSGHQGTRSQRLGGHGDGALSYEAAAAAAAALRPRKAEDPVGDSSPAWQMEGVSDRAAGTIQRTHSGRGRIVTIPARSSGRSSAERRLSDDATVTRDPLEGLAKPPKKSTKTAGQLSQAEALGGDDTKTSSSGGPVGTASGQTARHPETQTANVAGLRQVFGQAEKPTRESAVVSPPSPSKLNRGLQQATSGDAQFADTRVRIPDTSSDEASDLAQDKPPTSVTGSTPQKDPDVQLPDMTGSDAPEHPPTKTHKVSSKSHSPDEYELAPPNTAGPSQATVPRSAPSGADDPDVEDLRASLGNVTIKHHPELAVDYTRHEREPVVHEEKRTHVHTIYEPQRTRSFHFHERRDIIQPIIDPEPLVLPTQHWMEDAETGRVFKIPDELGRRLMEGEELRTSDSSN